MKLDPELLQKVKRKRLDEVELEWISRMESTPRDLPWFFAVAREMRAAKAHAKMAELLMLLCDNLALEDAWEEAFDAVREGIALSPRSKELRAKAVDCVRNRYAARDDLEDVIEFFEIETAADPLKAFEEMRDWLRFEPGAGFYLAGRGLGKVSDVNLALQKVQINFEKTAPLVVRRDEAAKLLTWIPSDHFMMRRLEDPETVRAEAKADPGAFMCELLACFARPLSAAEIRDSMSGIVEGARWHSWWARARSHPQVLASKEKRNTFTWSDTSEEAEQAVLDEFAGASLAERIDLTRRHAKRGDLVRAAMLEKLTQDLHRLAPSGSSKAVEVLCLLEELGAAPDPPPFTVDRVLHGPRAAEVILGVSDRRYRERMYARVREIRGDDWAQIYREGFRGEGDFRLMSQLYEAIRDHGPEGAAAKLVAESVSSPRRTPRPFVWVVRNVMVYEELRYRANHSLLSRLIDALDHAEFKELKAPLREQFEPSGFAFAVFEQADREGVDRLLNLIDSATSVEEHRKIGIRRAIFRKYPTIRKRTDEDALYATLEALEAKRGELEQLVRVEIPENTQAIRIAREHGDLRENFEYHAARQKHEILTARASRLEEELRKVRVIDPSAVDPVRVSLGTRVELAAVDGGEPRFAIILGPWDSDPDRSVFSHRSEVAKGLLGARVDDAVEIDGQGYRVSEIRVWRSPAPSPDL
jgi:transcription elongation GreA/GreB family factor